ncbi:MAG: toprim domain-containing protein [Thermoanaerobaculia bacterium]
MLISKADIDELKGRHELSAFVSSSGVELMKKGTYFVGRCPFHTPDKTPSLVVDPRKQIWNCLGACRANGNAGGGKGSSGGDLFAFAMKLWGVDFRETFKRLGGEVRNEIPPPRRRTNGNGAASSRPTAATVMTPTSRAPRMELFSRVVEKLTSELAQQRPAQEYLEARGLRTRALWRAFKLGYSSGSIEDLAGTDESSGTRRLLVELGILTTGGKERMKGRIVFPLVAFNQLPVGLYGRAIVETVEPHHMFLPGPRRGLFNWNAARSKKEILVVESVIDALSLVEAGVGNAIPLYGVSGLTDDHKELVKRCGVTSVVVALDADEAGKRAAPQILAAFEALGVKARAIEWPEKDPNELLVKEGPRKTREIVMKLLAPVAVSEAVNPLPLIAAPAVEVAPVEPAVKEEKQTAAAAPEASSAHDQLLGEVLTLTSGDRLWRVVWTEGCSPSHLRATVRVRLGEAIDAPSFLDALDLVSARARESFARRAASAPAATLADEARLSLQRALEGDLLKIADLGDERRRGIETRGAVSIAMTEEEKRQALTFLRDARLLDRIAEGIEALGYVGEDTNKKIGYLVSISRKLDAALSMVILSTSGSGKSGLAEALEAITPEEDLLAISRLSPQALYYMPKDALRRKFVSIEERAGSMEADYSIRSLQSKKKLTLAVPIKDPSTGRIETKVFEIFGPAAFLETTTESVINVENSTRCFEIHLDESAGQTRRIQDAQRRAKTVEGQRERTSRYGLVALHKNAQRLLKALPVVIPYAEAIEFPSAWIRTRRDNLRFLHLIEVLAFLHQYQRPLLDVKTGERVEMPLEEVIETEVETLAIEATLDDYAAAHALSKELLSDTFQDLSRAARELYDGIRNHVESATKDKALDARQVVFTRREIREASRLPNYRVKALFRELEELEYLTVTRGARGTTSAYQLVEGAESERTRVLGLLSPEELGRKLAHQTAPVRS